MKFRKFLLAGVCAAALPANVALADNGVWREPTEYSPSVLGANDDGSTGQIPLGFEVNFYGLVRDSVYVNNNGNITFDSALSIYTPFPLSSTSRQIIAPFFADVDTRGGVSGLVSYGNATVGGRRAFLVNWPGVGYYSQGTDKTNTFQLVLIDRSDIGEGNFDVEFNYVQIKWEAGSASGATGGLGGDSARVGYSNGSGEEGTSFELLGSAINGAFLDANSETGLANSSNARIPGRYMFRIRDGVGRAGAAPDFQDMSLNANQNAVASGINHLFSDVRIEDLFANMTTEQEVVAAISQLQPPSPATMPGGIVRAATNTVLSGRLSRTAPPGPGGGRPGSRSFSLAPGVTMDINPQAFRQFAGRSATSSAWMDQVARNILAAADSMPASNVRADPVDRPFAVFVEGVFDAGDIDATATQAGSDYFSRTIAVGGEYYLTRSFRIGVAVGGTSLDAGTDDASVTSENASLFVAHYGSYNPLGDFFLDYTVGFQQDNVEYTRNIGAPFNATTRADFDSTQLSASLRGSYLFDLGVARVQPYEELSWLRVETDAYRENGAGALDLAFNDQKSRALTNKLGVEASRLYRTDSMLVTPTLRAAWVHEFDDDPRLITAQFAGAPNAPFTIASDKSDANYFEAGFQVGAEFVGGTTLTFGYDTILGHDQLTNHRVVGNLRYRF